MKQLIIKCVAIFLFLHGSAYAGEPSLPLHFLGHYDLSFANIPLGQVDIDLTQESTQYHAKSNVTITGIARLFVEHDSSTSSKGTGSGFTYPNTDYASNYSTRKKPKSAAWERKDGKTIKDVVTPPDNRAVRPAVEENLKDNAFDPLAVSLAIRNGYINARKEGKTTFSVRYYDGRRLTQIDLADAGARTIRMDGKKLPVLSLTAKQKPIAGHTEKELARFNPNYVLTLNFENNERFMPVLLEVPLAFGIARATLTESKNQPPQ